MFTCGFWYKPQRKGEQVAWDCDLGSHDAVLSPKGAGKRWVLVVQGHTNRVQFEGTIIYNE